MNLHQSIAWRPGGFARSGMLAVAIGMILVLGWLHYLSGRAYEFHVFFGLPILVVAWFLGTRSAWVVVAVTISVWFAADWALEGDQADPAPLIFNSIMRLVISVAASWVLAQMRHILDREALLARQDTLTGLPNRRAFHEQGQAALSLAHRQQTPFSVVFVDLDKFKQVNDSLGHATGDALLRLVADILRSRIRTSDVVGRLGGDEFALLLPGMDGSTALSFVEDLRQRLLGSMLENAWPVTFSIGVVSCQRAPDALETLLREADQRMYAAKEAGRDRILQKVLDGVAR